MAKITLNSAAFHGFEFTVGPKRGEGAPMVIIEFTAPWTDANRKAGGWKDLPDSISGLISLIPGEIAATHFEFVPGKGFESHPISLDCSNASDFKCFCPTKEGEERELRFNIKTPTKNAGRILDTFGRTVGSATGKLKISHDENPPDERLLISPEQAADTAKTN